MSLKRMRGFINIGLWMAAASMAAGLVLVISIVAIRGAADAQRPVVMILVVITTLIVALAFSGWQTWIGVKQANKIH